MASFPHILPFPRQNPMRARMAPVAVAVVTAAVGIARALSLSGDDRTPANAPSSEPTTVVASATRSVDLTSNVLPEIAVLRPRRRLRRPLVVSCGRAPVGAPAVQSRGAGRIAAPGSFV